MAEYKSLVAQVREFMRENRNTKYELEKTKSELDYISMMSDIDINETEDTNREIA